MPKRRRERDRPKDRPDGMYDPNKRVLLSYDSADEASEVPAAIAAQPVLGDEVPAKVHCNTIVTGPPATPSVVNVTPARTTKHDHSKTNQQVRADDVAGQRPMFGLAGLDSGNDEWDQFYEDDTVEALAYLQAVKSERDEIPAVLSAARLEANNDTDDGDESYLGQFQELPDSIAQQDAEIAAQQAACDAYTASILARFDSLHRAIETPSSSEGTESLHGILYRIKASDKSSCSAWKRMIRQTPPTIDQLRAMTPHAARQVLEIMQRVHLHPNKDIPRLTSIWLLSLLARLEEYPRMHMEKVGELRNLARRAAKLKAALKQRLESSTFLDETTEEDAYRSDGSSSPDEDQGALEDSNDDGLSNTIATLDMIFVITGERFGQRDFLSERLWPAFQSDP